MSAEEDSKDFLEIKVPMEENLGIFNFDSIEREVMGVILMRMKTGISPSKVFERVFVGFGPNEAIVTTRNLGVIRNGSVFAGVCWEQLMEEYPDNSVLRQYYDWDYGVVDEIKVEDNDEISLHAGVEALSFDSEAISARLSNLEISHQSLKRGFAELKEDFRKSKLDADEPRRVRGRKFECRTENDDDGASARPGIATNAGARLRDVAGASRQGSRDNICLYIKGLENRRQLINLIDWYDDLLAIFRSNDHFVVVIKPDNHEQIVDEINGIRVKKGATQITCVVSRGNKWNTKHLIEKYGVGTTGRNAGNEMMPKGYFLVIFYF